MICTTRSLNCFCFDFHISAEQFYDRNKQELVKMWEKHKSTNNAMSNDGSSIEKIDQSHGDQAVNKKVTLDFYPDQKGIKCDKEQVAKVLLF